MRWYSNETEAALKQSEAPQRAWLSPALVLLASAFFGYLILPLLSRHVSSTGKLVGTPAPEFSLPILHGGDAQSRISLHALAGNVVVLDFWASWCKPCVAQARILSELAPGHAAENVVFVGINTADNPDRAQAFASAHQLPYPSVFDSGEVADAYGAQSLPTLVVIDPAGNIADVHVGVLSAGEIEEALRAAGAHARP
jgi:cytochrome c biogenesis protein CcmG, thiol:disulfide interchange protein DsbE